MCIIIELRIELNGLKFTGKKKKSRSFSLWNTGSCKLFEKVILKNILNRKIIYKSS